MPVSAAAHEAYAAEIRRAYAEAERVMLRKVAQRIERGIDGENWAAQKLAEVIGLNRDITQEIIRLRKLDPEIARAVEEAWNAGAADAVRDLQAAKLPMIAESPMVSRGAAVKILTSKLTEALGSTHFQILRTAQDAYRTVIAEASQQSLIGTMTRRQAAQRALNRFADRGVKGFVDASKREWDLTSYAEMATRTSMGQAAVEGHITKLADSGYDLVVVSGSPDPCDSCAPWEGTVVSLNGITPGYPTLAEATSNSHLMGPNCTHALSLWVPGVSKAPTLIPMEERKNRYQERQQQRANERLIRLWKKREAVALDDQTRAFTQAKIREAQARQRAFIAETGRRRQYERESIVRAR